MSIKCIAWALNDAPVEDPTHVLVLVAMAEAARDDGTDSFQYIDVIADKARISTRTAHRVMRALEEGGIITKGDQSATDVLTRAPRNRRPTCYDLDISLRRQPRPEPKPKPRGDNLTPQDQGEDMTPTSPQNESGVTPEGIRGDKETVSGVTPMADSPVQSRTVPSLKTGDGASAAQEPGTGVELPGMPPRADLVKAETTPEAKIARWAYEKTNGGLKYPAMQALGREAVKHNYPPGEVAKAMVTLFTAGRNVNQQSLAQYLQGIIRPNGTTHKPSTTDQRVQEAQALKAELLQEAAQ